MRWLNKATGGCLLLLVFTSGELQAALVTSAGAISSPTTFDFDGYSGPFVSIASAQPINIVNGLGDNISLSASDSFPQLGTVPDPPGAYGLGDNNEWDAGRGGFVALNSDSATVRFDFLDGPVSGVGGLVNYDTTSNTDFVITALDINDSVLESYIISDIDTNGAPNTGEFRGIVLAGQQISAFTITGRFGVLDDLTFGPSQASAVPEPSSLAILAVGACATVGRWRKRSRRKTVS